MVPKVPWLFVVLLILSTHKSLSKPFSNTPYFSVDLHIPDGFACHGNTLEIHASTAYASSYELQHFVAGAWQPYASYAGLITNGEISLQIANYTIANTFRLKIVGPEGEAFSSQLSAVPQRPVFDFEPIDLRGCNGDDAYFKASVDTPLAAQYQWQVDHGSGFINTSESTYLNANSPTLEVDKLNNSDDGDFFRLKVIDANGCENITRAAKLSVNTHSTPVPTTSVEYCEGDEFTVSARGVQGPVLSYEWGLALGTSSSYQNLVEGERYSGVDQASLTVKKIDPSERNYRLIVNFEEVSMSDNGTAVISTCNVNKTRRGYVINASPDFSGSIGSMSPICEGEAIEIVANASSSNLEWYADSTLSPIANGATFTSSSLSSDTTFFVSETGPNGCQSNFEVIDVVVNPIPEIISISALDTCSSASSFKLNYLSSIPTDLISIYEGSIALDDFDELYDQEVINNTINIPIPSNAQPGDYDFRASLKNSISSCSSLPVDFEVKIKKPIKIVRQPMTENVCLGDSVKFIVNAEGDGLLTYQWYHEGSPILGQTSASLLLTSVQEAMAGNYYCQVNGECGMVQSNKAALQLKSPTIIVTQPLSKTVCEGSEAIFEVKASGEGNLSYQWFKNDTIITGANESKLELQHIGFDENSSTFYCQVTGACGSVNTSVCDLVVNKLPKTPIASNINYCQGDVPTPLVATPSQNGNSLFWRFSTESTLSTEAPTPSTQVPATLTYYLSEQNTATSCISNEIQVKVVVLPELKGTITQDLPLICNTGPINNRIKLQASFSGGNGTIDYSWFGVGIDGATSDSVQVSQGGYYYVRASSGGVCSDTLGIYIKTPNQRAASPRLTVDGLNFPDALSLCPGDSINLQAIHTTQGAKVNWYDSENSLDVLFTGTTRNLSEVLAPRSLYARVELEQSGISCLSDLGQISLKLNAKPRVNVSVIKENCNSDGNGIITLNPADDDEAYSYALGDEAFTDQSTFENLTSGSYLFRIRNGFSCIADTLIAVGRVAEPVITGQPISLNNCKGNTVTFSAEVAKYEELQWQQKIASSWQDLEGEQDEYLRIENVGSLANPHLSEYRLQAVNESCSVQSDIATLSVNSISGSVPSQQVCQGDAFEMSLDSFTVVGDLLSVQWQYRAGTSGGWSLIPGQNTSVLNISNFSQEKEGYYRARLTFQRYDGSTCIENTSTGRGFFIEYIGRPEFSISGDTLACMGETILFTSLGCTGTTNWSTGHTGSQLYYEVLSDVNISATCTLGSCEFDCDNTLNIRVNGQVNTPLVSQDKSLICVGDSVLLQAAHCSGNVSWSNGFVGISQFVKPHQNTSYSAVCQYNNCVSASSDTLTVSISLPSLAGEIAQLTGDFCQGYNPPMIRSVSDGAGGRDGADFTYFWQERKGCEGDWTLIENENEKTYNPGTLSERICLRRAVVSLCDTAFSNVSQIDIMADPSIVLTANRSEVCSGESLTIQASLEGGAGSCLITWQVNERTSAPSSGFWEDLAETGLEVTFRDLTNHTALARQFYVRAIVDCSPSSCNKARSEALIVTVLPSTSLNLNIADTTICSGNEVELRVSDCNGDLSWGDGNTALSRQVSPMVSTSYTVTCLGSCDTLSRTASITVVESLQPPAIYADKTILCHGDSLALRADACEGTVLWSNGFEGLQQTVNLGSDTIFFATCQNESCESIPSNSIAVEVSEPLTAGSIDNLMGEYCAGYNPPTIRSISDASGGSLSAPLTYFWQESTSCSDNWSTIPNENTAIFNPSPLKERTCYRRGVTSICGDTLYSNVSSVPISNDPSIVISISEDSLCSYQELRAAAVVSGGVGDCLITWQVNYKSDAPTSSFWEDLDVTGQRLVLDSLVNTTVNIQSVFLRAVVDCSPVSCNKATSDAVVVYIKPSFDFKFRSGSDTTLCRGNALDISVSSCGGEFTWSDGFLGTHRVVKPVSPVVYSASCSNSCGSVEKSFDVNLVPGIAPPKNTSPEYSVLPNKLVFSAEGEYLKWYQDSISTEFSIEAPKVSSLGRHVYWVSQSNSTCESPRLKVISSLFEPLRLVEMSNDQFDCEGNSVKFNVHVVGVGKLHYYWQRKRPGESEFSYLKEGERGVKNVNTPYLTVSRVGRSENPNQSMFRCQVIDQEGTITTDTRKLYANVLYGTLPNYEACVGQEFQYVLRNKIVLEGDVERFQWQRRIGSEWTDLSDEGAITGTNSDQLKFSKLALHHAGRYRCRVYFNTGGFHCIENTDLSRLSVGTYPQKPIVTNEDYCQGKRTKRVGYRAEKGNDERWYFSKDQATGSGTGKEPRPSSVHAGEIRYYVSQISDEGCESEREELLVTIHPKPPLPTNSTPEYVNEGEVLTFSANGQNLKWYTSRTARKFSELNPEYTLVDTYKHYVSQESEVGCQSDRTLIPSAIVGKLGFTREPDTLSECKGNMVTFQVKGKGPEGFYYQWQKKRPQDSTYFTIENEFEDDYKIADAGDKENPDGTLYRALVIHDLDTVFSHPGKLIVNVLEGEVPDMKLCDNVPTVVNTSALKVQGWVSQYLLQRKTDSTWLTVDSSSQLHFVQESIDSSFEGTYRVRVMFISENRFICPRNSRTFKINIGDTISYASRALSDSIALCTFNSIHSGLNNLGLDETTQAYVGLEDEWIFANEPLPQKEGAMVFEIEGPNNCIALSDSVRYKLILTDSLKLNTSNFSTCLGEQFDLEALEDTSQYLWFKDSLIQQAVFDFEKLGTYSYRVARVDSNGCMSNKQELYFSVEDCSHANTRVARNTRLSYTDMKDRAVCYTYPNPINLSQKTTLYTGEIKISQVTMHDLIGNSYPIVFKEKTTGLNDITLPLGLAPGLYLVSVASDDGKKCHVKLVKN